MPRAVDTSRRHAIHLDATVFPCCAELCEHSFGEDRSCAANAEQRRVGATLLDGTSLPSDSLIAVYGCGENYPLPEAEAGSAWERFSEQRNRRVEFLFFDRLLGITPTMEKPQIAAPGSKVYPAWIAKAEIEDLSTEAGQQPTLSMARLVGAYFDTNKCFLLPTVIPTLKKLVELYKAEGIHQVENQANQSTVPDVTDAELVIVGHTDTSGTPDYNQTLSEERARAMADYLHDDVEAWLKWFDSSKPDSKRWGKREEQMMMLALVAPAQWLDVELTLAFQKWHNAQDFKSNRPLPNGWLQLTEDGNMGPNTRRQLVIDYMNIDGTSIETTVPITCLGCGERYPVRNEDGELDPAAADGQHEQEDRRVEVFFAKPAGLHPALSGPKEAGQYPVWSKLATPSTVLDSVRKGRVVMRIHNRKLKPTSDEIVVFEYGSEWAVGITDEEGLAEFPGPPPNTCMETKLYWGSPVEAWDPQHRRAILLDCNESADSRDWNRLHNIGYEYQDVKGPLLANFQWDYEVPLDANPNCTAPPTEVIDKLKQIWIDKKCTATPDKEP